MSKIIQLLWLLLEIVTKLINMYNEARQKEKYEKANSDTTNQWVDGFGVRHNKEDDPTKTTTKQ